MIWLNPLTVKKFYKLVDDQLICALLSHTVYSGSPKHGDDAVCYRNMIAWRLDVGADTILQNFEPPQFLQDYYPARTLQNTDKEGDPVLCEKMGKVRALCWFLWVRWSTQRGFFVCCTSLDIVASIFPNGFAYWFKGIIFKWTSRWQILLKAEFSHLPERTILLPTICCQGSCERWRPQAHLRKYFIKCHVCSFV